MTRFDRKAIECGQISSERKGSSIPLWNKFRLFVKSGHLQSWLLYKTGNIWPDLFEKQSNSVKSGPISSERKRSCAIFSTNWDYLSTQIFNKIVLNSEKVLISLNETFLEKIVHPIEINYQLSAKNDRIWPEIDQIGLIRSNFFWKKTNLHTFLKKFRLFVNLICQKNRSKLRKHFGMFTWNVFRENRSSNRKMTS